MDSVEEEIETMKQLVDKMDEKVFAVEKVIARIEKIKHPQQKEYYNLLYRTIINHFLAYRVAATGFFEQKERNHSKGDKMLEHLCMA